MDERGTHSGRLGKRRGVPREGARDAAAESAPLGGSMAHRLVGTVVAAAVVLSLTSCKGASGEADGQTPSVTVSPVSTTVTAGRGTVALAAALSGGAAGTIRWTVGGPGTVSPAEGPTTTYMPPAAVSVPTGVTITATAGGLSGTASITVVPDTPVVTVFPATATVIAGAGTVALTATLSPWASGTVSWSVTGAGSVYPLLGPSTSYTPPASVAAPTEDVVTAIVGSVQGSAVITVLPAGATETITGTVVDLYGLPVQGALIWANDGAPTSSAADGTFTLTGVALPYRLTATRAIGGTTAVGTVFEGLHRIDPVVPLRWVDRGLWWGSVEGTVLGLGPPAPRVVLVAAGGAAFNDQPRASADAGTGAYGPMVLQWFGNAAFSGMLYALCVDLDAAGDVVGYRAGGTAFAIESGQSLTGKDVLLSDPLPAGTLSVSVAFPAGLLCGGAGGTCSGELRGLVQFHDAAILGISEPLIAATSSFTQLAPDLSSVGGSITLEAEASSAAGAAEARFRNVLPSATVAMSLRDPPSPIAPADGAADVGAGSAFQWVAGAFADGVSLLRIQPFGPDGWYIDVYTASASWTLLDGLPSGAEYQWEVISQGPVAGVDEIAGGAAPAATELYQGHGPVRRFTAR